MKFNLSRLSVIVFSALLSTNVTAKETVFYCQQKASVAVKKQGVDQHRIERFKLKVTPEAITFGKDFRLLSGNTIPFEIGKESSLSQYAAPNDWWIINYTDHMSMSPDGAFLFLQNYRFEGLAVFAICEIF